MKATTIITLLTAIVVIGTAVAVFQYSDCKDDTCTTVEVGDGITCTINGESVANGDTVCIKRESGKLRIHVESEFDALLGFKGVWTSEGRTVRGAGVADDVCKTADFTVNFDHGEYKGTLLVANLSTDGDLGPINLTFSFDESKVTVTHAGAEVKNGDVVSFPNDGTFTVESKIGRCNLSYGYKWSNPDGFSGGGNYSELNTSITGHVINTCYFDAGTGTMDITATPES